MFVKIFGKVPLKFDFDLLLILGNSISKVGIIHIKLSVDCERWSLIVILLLHFLFQTVEVLE